EAQGATAFEQKQWPQAAPAYREAYELQQQINQAFRGTRYSNHYRARQLQDKLRVAEAGLMYQGAQKWIRTAEEQAALGKAQEATRLYNEAEKELLRLIESYPANPFVSRSSLGDILRNRENLEAFPWAHKILTA